MEDLENREARPAALRVRVLPPRERSRMRTEPDKAEILLSPTYYFSLRFDYRGLMRSINTSKPLPPNPLAAVAYHFETFPRRNHSIIFKHPAPTGIKNSPLTESLVTVKLFPRFNYPLRIEFSTRISIKKKEKSPPNEISSSVKRTVCIPRVNLFKRSFSQLSNLRDAQLILFTNSIFHKTAQSISPSELSTYTRSASLDQAVYKIIEPKVTRLQCVPKQP